MKGRPPEVFTGDRTKSEAFLEEFAIYRLANQNSSVMKTPLERVALALTYITGPHVRDWRGRILREMQRLTSGNRALAPDNEILWQVFERDFRSAFTDRNKKTNAHQKFLEVKMKGDELEDFIAEFEHLRVEAEWAADDMGAINQFRKGLKPALHRAILERTTQRPSTLREWMDAARVQHDLWVEIKACLQQDRGPTGRWPQGFGRTRPGGQGTQPPARNVRRPTNGTPMDVDAIQINAAMTPEERQKLQSEGRCFHCKNRGT